MEKQQLKFSTLGSYETPKCDAQEINLAVNICSTWENSIKEGTNWNTGNNDYGLE